MASNARSYTPPATPLAAYQSERQAVEPAVATPAPSPTTTQAIQGTGARARQAPSLSSRALRALTRREYSRAELHRKLSPYAEHAQQLEGVLDAMQAKGFLSDTRAAEAVARQKSARFGNARIQQELRAKGLDKELISNTLATLEDNEWERAQQVWSSKFGHLDLSGLDWPERHKAQSKQLRFMLGRGFKAELVRKLVHTNEIE